MATSKIVVVTDQYTGEAHRFNISNARDLDISRTNWDTGIDLETVYLQPRAKRVIVEFYSRWDAGDGRTRGTYYTEADNDLIARIAREFDCEELAALLPEFIDEVR